ncbi:MAG: TlyA family RNA methyltransferase [Actinomycetes bacterium]
MRRQRLDHALVERGLFDSRTSAVEAITAGRVLVAGSVADKSSRQVSPGDPIVVTGSGPRFVSRGGSKLERGIQAFSVSPVGRTAVDAGSATGGFTDCLLQSGALGVLAVDVGYGQLHEKLRSDARVVSLERTNIRDVDRQKACEALSPLPPPSLVVADLSFTSLRPLVERLLDLSGPEGELLVLCKPQFEVGRQVAARGKGVVRDRQDRRGALLDVIATFEGAGATIMGIVSSPILGPAGNAEFIVFASKVACVSATTVEQMADAALDEAELLS